jgi:hypothetical protein
VCGIGIDLTALRHRPGAPPALARMVEVPDLVGVPVCFSVFLAHRALLLRPRGGRLWADRLSPRGGHG